MASSRWRSYLKLVLSNVGIVLLIAITIYVPQAAFANEPWYMDYLRRHDVADKECSDQFTLDLRACSRNDRWCRDNARQDVMACHANVKDEFPELGQALTQRDLAGDPPSGGQSGRRSVKAMCQRDCKFQYSGCQSVCNSSRIDMCQQCIGKNTACMERCQKYPGDDDDQ